MEAVDETMLMRTLQQLSKNQRSLASLHVQLSQAENIRTAAVHQAGRGVQGRTGRPNKWERITTTLRAAIAMRTPLPSGLAAHLRHGTYGLTTDMESSGLMCLMTGWLSHLGPEGRSTGGRTQGSPYYACLRSLNGLLFFPSDHAPMPISHMAFDDGTRVEAPIVPVGASDADLPHHAFRVRTGMGTVATFVCTSPPALGGQARETDLQGWVDAIRSVVHARKAEASQATPIA